MARGRKIALGDAKRTNDADGTRTRNHWIDSSKNPSPILSENSVFSSAFSMLLRFANRCKTSQSIAANCGSSTRWTASKTEVSVFVTPDFSSVNSP
jgi:hypothetical protein